MNLQNDLPGGLLDEFDVIDTWSEDEVKYNERLTRESRRPTKEHRKPTEGEIDEFIETLKSVNSSDGTSEKEKAPRGRERKSRFSDWSEGEQTNYRNLGHDTHDGYKSFNSFGKGHNTSRAQGTNFQSNVYYDGGSITKTIRVSTNTEVGTPVKGQEPLHTQIDSGLSQAPNRYVYIPRKGGYSVPEKAPIVNSYQETLGSTPNFTSQQLNVTEKNVISDEDFRTGIDVDLKLSLSKDEDLRFALCNKKFYTGKRQSDSFPRKRKSRSRSREPVSKQRKSRRQSSRSKSPSVGNFEKSGTEEFCKKWENKIIQYPLRKLQSKSPTPERYRGGKSSNSRDRFSNEFTDKTEPFRFEQSNHAISTYGQVRRQVETHYTIPLGMKSHNIVYSCHGDTDLRQLPELPEPPSLSESGWPSDLQYGSPEVVAPPPPELTGRGKNVRGESSDWAHEKSKRASRSLRRSPSIPPPPPPPKLTDYAEEDDNFNLLQLSVKKRHAETVIKERRHERSEKKPKIDENLKMLLSDSSKRLSSLLEEAIQSDKKSGVNINHEIISRCEEKISLLYHKRISNIGCFMPDLIPSNLRKYRSPVYFWNYCCLKYNRPIEPKIWKQYDIVESKTSPEQNQARTSYGPSETHRIETHFRSSVKKVHQVKPPYTANVECTKLDFQYDYNNCTQQNNFSTIPNYNVNEGAYFGNESMQQSCTDPNVYQSANAEYWPNAAENYGYQTNFSYPDMNNYSLQGNPISSEMPNYSLSSNLDGSEMSSRYSVQSSLVGSGLANYSFQTNPVGSDLTNFSIQRNFSSSDLTNCSIQGNPSSDLNKYNSQQTAISSSSNFQNSIKNVQGTFSNPNSKEKTKKKKEKVNLGREFLRDNLTVIPLTMTSDLPITTEKESNEKMLMIEQGSSQKRKMEEHHSEMKIRQESNKKNERQTNQRSKYESTRKAEYESTRKVENESTRKMEHKTSVKTEHRSYEKSERRSNEKSERKYNEKLERKSHEKTERKSHEKTERKSHEKTERKSNEKTERSKEKSERSSNQKANQKVERQPNQKSEQQPNQKVEQQKPTKKVDHQSNQNQQKPIQKVDHQSNENVDQHPNQKVDCQPNQKIEQKPYQQKAEQTVEEEFNQNIVQQINQPVSNLHTLNSEKLSSSINVSSDNILFPAATNNVGISFPEFLANEHFRPKNKRSRQIINLTELIPKLRQLQWSSDLKRVLDSFKVGSSHPDYYLNNGLVSKTINGSNKIVIPDSNVHELVEILHCLKSGHTSAKKIYLTVDTHFTPLKDIESALLRLFENCKLCSNKPEVQLLRSFLTYNRPHSASIYPSAITTIDLDEVIDLEIIEKEDDLILTNAKGDYINKEFATKLQTNKNDISIETEKINIENISSEKSFSLDGNKNNLSASQIATEEQQKSEKNTFSGREKIPIKLNLNKNKISGCVNQPNVEADITSDRDGVSLPDKTSLNCLGNSLATQNLDQNNSLISNKETFCSKNSMSNLGNDNPQITPDFSKTTFISDSTEKCEVIDLVDSDEIHSAQRQGEKFNSSKHPSESQNIACQLKPEGSSSIQIGPFSDKVEPPITELKESLLNTEKQKDAANLKVVQCLQPSIAETIPEVNINLEPTHVESSKASCHNDLSKLSSSQSSPKMKDSIAKKVNSVHPDTRLNESSCSITSGKNVKQEEERANSTQSKPNASQTVTLGKLLMNKVREFQSINKEIMDKIQALKAGDKDINETYLFRGNMLCRKYTINGHDELKIVVPIDSIEIFISLVHSVSGTHASLSRTITTMQKYFSPVPDLEKHVSSYINKCEKCNKKS